jgi:hypothetical protein
MTARDQPTAEALEAAAEIRTMIGERLVSEHRASWRRKWCDPVIAKKIDALVARHVAEARRAALEALTPFAEMVGGWTGNGYDESPDEDIVRSVGTMGRDYAVITVGDLRRARRFVDELSTPSPITPPAEEG